MQRARLALLTPLGCRKQAAFLRADQGKGLVQPLPAQPELVLARVHREAEALLRRLAPHAPALLLQAARAVWTHVARRWTLNMNTPQIIL